MEEKLRYSGDIETEFTVNLFDSDLQVVKDYINKNRDSLKLPEEVYSVLAIIVSSYFYGEGR